MAGGGTGAAVGGAAGPEQEMVAVLEVAGPRRTRVSVVRDVPLTEPPPAGELGVRHQKG